MALDTEVLAFPLGQHTLGADSAGTSYTQVVVSVAVVLLAWDVEEGLAGLLSGDLAEDFAAAFEVAEMVVAADKQP